MSRERDLLELNDWYRKLYAGEMYLEIQYQEEFLNKCKDMLSKITDKKDLDGMNENIYWTETRIEALNKIIEEIKL